MFVSTKSLVRCDYAVTEACPAEARAAMLKLPSIVHLSERHDPHPLFVRIPPTCDFPLISCIYYSVYKVIINISVVVTLDLLGLINQGGAMKKGAGMSKNTKQKSEPNRRTRDRAGYLGSVYLRS